MGALLLPLSAQEEKRLDQEILTVLGMTFSYRTASVVSMAGRRWTAAQLSARNATDKASQDDWRR